AERCEWSLIGNHDFAVLYEPTNFNPGAEQAAFWTRAQFDAEPDEKARAKRYEFLGRLRVRVLETPPDGKVSILAVHGSPRRPINEYIFPDDAMTAVDKMKQIFERIERLAIVGHTHVPGVFTDEPDFYPPAEIGAESSYIFNDREKAIINVGSVGQPRDHDPRASYAILHPDRVEFVRIEYDVNKTAKKIYGVPELSDWLGDRLLEGR
ncbi:MAG: metallophosphoesterase family protein, partial [Planctomycetota bacterium]|nr:metallophosphoesterase family protein [Planctomycetota bacterium]